MGFITSYDENLSMETRRESLVIHSEDADIDYAPRDQFGHGHAELGYTTVAKLLLWIKRQDEDGKLPPPLKDAYWQICQGVRDAMETAGT